MVQRTIAMSVMVCVAAALLGCGGTPLVYTDSREEKPGPGLFSGEDGVFTLLEKKRVESGEVEKDEPKNND
jgi:hypothetical protein